MMRDEELALGASSIARILELHSQHILNRVAMHENTYRPAAIECLAMDMAEAAALLRKYAGKIPVDAQSDRLDKRGRTE